MAPSVFLAAALALAAMVARVDAVSCAGTSCVGVGAGCTNTNPVCTIPGSSNNVCSGATQTSPSSNKCKNCNATLTSTDWSSVIGGTVCAGTNICSGTGQCLQGCWLGYPDGGGIVNTLNAPIPGNFFVANTPANNAVGQGTKFYTQSDFNPSEFVCQFCDTNNAVYGFSFAADGDACLSVTQTTTGVCQTGVCVPKCFIGGNFVNSGEYDNDKCGVCDPANNPFDWTYNIADGTACPVGGPNTNLVNDGVCLGAGATPVAGGPLGYTSVSVCTPPMSAASSASTSATASAPATLQGSCVCAGGYYCPTGACSSATLCPPGHYCPPGSVTWRYKNCGRGNYCPWGSSAPIACPPKGTVDAVRGPANGACPRAQSLALRLFAAPPARRPKSVHATRRPVAAPIHPLRPCARRPCFYE